MTFEKEFQKAARDVRDLQEHHEDARKERDLAEVKLDLARQQLKQAQEALHDVVGSMIAAEGVIADKLVAL